MMMTSGPMTALGNTVDIQGTYVIKIRKTNMMAKKGRAAV